MTPELVNPLSIVIVLGILGGLWIGRRHGERRERERKEQSATLNAITEMRRETGRNAEETRDRLQHLERNVDHVHQDVERTIHATGPAADSQQPLAATQPQPTAKADGQPPPGYAARP